MGQAQSFISAGRYQGVAGSQQRRHVIDRADAMNSTGQTARAAAASIAESQRTAASSIREGSPAMTSCTTRAAANGKFVFGRCQDGRQQLQPLLRTRIGQREEHEIAVANAELPPQGQTRLAQLGGPLERGEIDAVPNGPHGDGNSGLLDLRFHRLRAMHQQGGLARLQSRQLFGHPEGML